MSHNSTTGTNRVVGYGGGGGGGGDKGGGGDGGGNTPDIEVSQANVIFIQVIMIYFLSRLQTPSIPSGYYSRQKHYCSLNISLTYNNRDTPGNVGEHFNLNILITIISMLLILKY